MQKLKNLNLNLNLLKALNCTKFKFFAWLEILDRHALSRQYFLRYIASQKAKINPTSFTEWKIHIVHCNSASNRGNLKVFQRIAPFQVVIDALFISEDPKNFSMRTVWRNAQNTPGKTLSKSSFRWMAPGSRRNVNRNLFTAIFKLLKPSFKKRYRTSLCNMSLMCFLVV